MRRLAVPLGLLLLPWRANHAAAKRSEAVPTSARTSTPFSTDSETTWFEGVLLIGVYVLFGMPFFFSAPIA
ncbi:MAG: hypothetical protein M3Z16_11610 [Pseudomonadota bacterium]|nr:hypothetical protein [Pseudomonadota bacterium]